MKRIKNVRTSRIDRVRRSEEAKSHIKNSFNIIGESVKTQMSVRKIFEIITIRNGG